ncbi:MAG: GAF domain-containing protein, partial [Succinivibrio sp.]
MENNQNSILLALRQIIQEVSAKSSFDDAATLLVSRLRLATSADCCSLYLLNARKTQLYLAATDGLQQDSVGKATLLVGEGLVGLVAQKQELLNLADAPGHPNFKYLPDVGEDEFLSFMGVPVINQGELLGVLVIQCKEHRVFGEQEEALLVTLSAQIASVISISRSTKETVDLNVKRYKGKTGSGSIAIAQAVVWKPPVTFETIQIKYSDDKEIQSELFHQTIFQLQMEMDRAALQLQESSHSKAASGYMSGYGSILDDLSFESEVDSEIFANGYVAASAIKVVASKRIAEAKEAGETDKARDLRDFAAILITRLVHLSPGVADVTNPIVLVVKSMPAALVAEMPRDKIAGFVCVDNATSSHTSILARDLGIPAVMDVHLDLDEVDGHTIIVDGQNAEVLVDPASSVVDEYVQLLSQTRKQHELFESEKYEKGI